MEGAEGYGKWEARTPERERTNIRQARNRFLRIVRLSATLLFSMEAYHRIFLQTFFDRQKKCHCRWHFLSCLCRTEGRIFVSKRERQANQQVDLGRPVEKQIWFSLSEWRRVSRKEGRRIRPVDRQGAIKKIAY